jgi:apolipoprotein N-acyltransferase
MTKFISPKKRIIFFYVVIFLFWSSESHAYFDPGTGSQLLQLLLAGLFGFLFTIKTYFHKIKVFFKKLISNKNEDINE